MYFCFLTGGTGKLRFPYVLNDDRAYPKPGPYTLRYAGRSTVCFGPIRPTLDHHWSTGTSTRYQVGPKALYWYDTRP